MAFTWDDYSGGNYVEAKDIEQKQPLSVVIIDVQIEILQDRQGRQETKPVAFFRGAHKGLPLNKTNCSFLRDTFGPDPSDSIGKTVELFNVDTELGRGIRLRLPTQQQPPPQQSQSYQRPATDRPYVDPNAQPGDDPEIPF